MQRICFCCGFLCPGEKENLNKKRCMSDVIYELAENLWRSGQNGMLEKL